MHRVGLIVSHGFQLLSLAPLTAFEMTGYGLAKSLRPIPTTTSTCCRNTAALFRLPLA
jgi:hypothetical protein